MTEALAVLLSLQEHDSAIALLKRSLGSLPERVAAHELNERRHAIEQQLTGLTTHLDDLAAVEEEVEKDLAVIEDRAKGLDNTLRAPGSASRDAQAIIHEIDHLRERAGALEERGLELLEQRDGLLGEQKAAQAELDQVAADAPGVLAAMRTAEGDAGVELARLESERAVLVADVEAPLLATYDKLRAQLNGVAVAQVVNGTCTGCHLSLAAADLEHIARLKPGESATCEQCGRILVPS